jgi:L-fuconolactonase
LIDTHVHLWDPAVGYPWLTESSPLHRRFGMDDLHAAIGEHSSRLRVILVEAGRGDDSESIDLLATAARHDLVAGAVVAADLRTHAGRDALTRLVAGPYGRFLLGIRHHADAELAVIAESGQLLRDAQLVVEISAPWWWLGRVAKLATRLAGVTVVLDHCGGPPPVGAPNGDFCAWRQALIEVAAVPTGVGDLRADKSTPRADPELAARAASRVVCPVPHPTSSTRSRSETLAAAVNATW